MKLRKWVKFTVFIISVIFFIALLKVDVNLPMPAKIFYSTIICGSLNLLAYMEY